MRRLKNWMIHCQAVAHMVRHPLRPLSHAPPTLLTTAPHPQLERRAVQRSAGALQKRHSQLQLHLRPTNQVAQPQQRQRRQAAAPSGPSSMPDPRAT